MVFSKRFQFDSVCVSWVCCVGAIPVVVDLVVIALAAVASTTSPPIRGYRKG